jgi:hypothetical protein
MPSDSQVFDELKLPFIFVPHGAPEPVEWLGKHPDWIKLPATVVPRGRGSARENLSSGNSLLRRPGTIDGLGGASGPAPPRPAAGTAMSGAMPAGTPHPMSHSTSDATNSPSGLASMTDDPIAAYRRASEAMATAARAHALEYGLGRTGATPADMHPADDPIQQEPSAGPPIQQEPFAPPPGHAFPSPAISDSQASPGASPPFLQPGFVPGTKDVMKFGTDGLIHDPTMEKNPPEIGLPRRTDTDT